MKSAKMLIEIVTAKMLPALGAYFFVALASITKEMRVTGAYHHGEQKLKEIVSFKCFPRVSEMKRE